MHNRWREVCIISFGFMLFDEQLDQALNQHLFAAHGLVAVSEILFSAHWNPWPKAG